jgi:hypothetical protein
MAYVNAGKMPVGLVGLAVTVALTAGFSGDAVAKHRIHVVRNVQRQDIQTASVREAARPLTMRYYGGPKSPMWSGE